MYIAGRRMSVPGRGAVEPGEPVPEAATWRNLRVYIDQRRILVVPDEEVPRPLTDEVVTERLHLGGRGPAPSLPEATKSEPPSRFGALRAALVQVKIIPKSHSIRGLWTLAQKAGLDLPRRPGTKAKVIAKLSELLDAEV